MKDRIQVVLAKGRKSSFGIFSPRRTGIADPSIIKSDYCDSKVQNIARKTSVTFARNPKS